MATFRQHHTGATRTTLDGDEIAELEADALWQHIGDDEAVADAESPTEPTLDEIVAKLGEGSTAGQRNLLREALAQFDDAPTPYDPAGHSVAEVNEYLVTADLDETTRVLAAEAAGKARAGILTGPHAGQS